MWCLDHLDNFGQLMLGLFSWHPEFSWPIPPTALPQSGPAISFTTRSRSPRRQLLLIGSLHHGGHLLPSENAVDSFSSPDSLQSKPLSQPLVPTCELAQVKPKYTGSSHSKTKVKQHWTSSLRASQSLYQWGQLVIARHCLNGRVHFHQPDAGFVSWTKLGGLPVSEPVGRCLFHFSSHRCSGFVFFQIFVSGICFSLN